MGEDNSIYLSSPSRPGAVAPPTGSIPCVLTNKKIWTSQIPLFVSHLGLGPLRRYNCLIFEAK